MQDALVTLEIWQQLVKSNLPEHTLELFIPYTQQVCTVADTLCDVISHTVIHKMFVTADAAASSHDADAA